MADEIKLIDNTSLLQDYFAWEEKFFMDLADLER